MSRKHRTSLYAKSMKNVYDLVDVSNNSQFKSMLTAKRPSGEKDYTKMSLDDLMNNYADYLFRLSTHNPNPNVQTDTFPDVDKAENALLQLGTEIKNRFEAYKKNHNEYEGADYRKYDYMTNVIAAYETAQESLDSYKDIEQYDPRADLQNQQALAQNYNLAQTDLYEKVSDFDAFREDPDYDASFLSNANDTLLKDKSLTAEMALHIGPDNLVQDIDLAIQNEETDIQQINESYQEAIKDIQDRRTDFIQSMNANFDEARDRIVKQAADEKALLVDEQNILTDLLGAQNREELISNYTQAAQEFNNLDFKKVNKSIRGGGEAIKGDDSNTSWIERIDASDANAVRDRMDILNSKSTEIQQSYDRFSTLIPQQEEDIKIQKEELAQAEKEFANLDKDPEYKKMDDALKNSADEIKGIDSLMDDIRNKGIDNIAPERLNKYGLSYNARMMANEAIGSKEDIDAFNKVANKGILSSIGGNLAKGLKEMNQIFNKDFDKLKELGKTYADKNGGRLPYDFTHQFGINFNDAKEYLDKLQGFSGKMKTAQEAAYINRIFKNQAGLEHFADSIPDNAPKEFLNAKKSITNTLKAFDELQKSDAYLPMITLAGVAETFGSKKDIEQNILTSLNETAKQMKQDHKELEGQTTGKYKQNKQTVIDGLKEELKLSEDNLEYIKNEREKDGINLKYLETAKKLLETKAAKDQFVDTKEELNAKLSKNKEAHIKLDKETTEKLDTLENMRKDSVKKESAKFDQEVSDTDALRDKMTGEHTSKISSFNKFKDKLIALNESKNDLVDAAKKSQKATDVLKEKINGQKNLIQSNKNKMLAGLNKAEKAIFEKMSKSKKAIFGDTQEFKDMISAMKGYIEANDASNVKTSAENIDRATKARYYIEDYITKKKNPDKLRSTSTGQLRLDCAKQFLKLIDQKEAMLDMHNQELERITTKENQISTITVKQNIEKQILRDSHVRLDAKEALMTKAEQNMLAGSTKIKNYFSGIKDMVSEKNKYLGDRFEDGVKSLTKRDMAGFTKGVAAAFLAERLKGKQLDETQYKSLDKMVNLFAKTDTVKNITSQIASGKITATDMKTMFNNNEMAVNISDEMAGLTKNKQPNQPNRETQGPTSSVN